MRAFSKEKFLTLNAAKQHKECAWLLRTLYENLAHLPAKESYLNYCTWMHIQPYPIQSKEQISNAYHEHLKMGGITLKEPRFLPPINTSDRKEQAPSLGFSIYLDNLRSTHNVGSILRTTEAFHLGSVHFSEKTPFITHKQVQDTSMGTYQWLKCYQTPLKSLPKPLIALETSPQSISIHEFDFPGPCTIALGNEEYGLSEETLDLADTLIHIPLRGRKNSLNVANAFAILAGEISRRFGGKAHA